MAFSIQKANFWKRFSAWLVDTFLVILLAVAFCFPTLKVFHYESYGEQLIAIQDIYRPQFEEEYNTDLTISEETYNELSDADKKRYEDGMAAFEQALFSNEEYVTLRAERATAIFATVTISLFLGVLLAHFFLPLCLQNGQTLGKKTFGTAVIRTNGVKITPMQLFVRSIVGLFTIETAALAFLLMVYPVGTIAGGILLILQIAVMIKTPTNSSIHDLLADTAVVDFSSQQIFATEQDRLNYLAKEAEDAANATSTY